MARPSLDDRIKNKEAELTELKRQRRGQLKRERSEEEKKNTRRKILIGGAIVKCFPELNQLDPTGKKAFPEIEGIAARLAHDPDFLALLEKLKTQL